MGILELIFIELLILIWLICGIIGFLIMKAKGYENDEALNWAVVSFFLGLVGLIILLFKKTRNTTSHGANIFHKKPEKSTIYAIIGFSLFAVLILFMVSKILEI